jgi:hypothetical protein
MPTRFTKSGKASGNSFDLGKVFGRRKYNEGKSGSVFASTCEANGIVLLMISISYFMKTVKIYLYISYGVKGSSEKRADAGVHWKRS